MADPVVRTVVAAAGPGTELVPLLAVWPDGDQVVPWEVPWTSGATVTLMVDDDADPEPVNAELQGWSIVAAVRSGRVRVGLHAFNSVEDAALGAAILS